MRCLIIKNDGIGDLVLASGLIAAIGERFQGEVDLVTCLENREIAEGIVPLRERLYVSRDSLHFSRRAWSLGVLWPRMTREDARVVRLLRSRHYDVAISLRRFIRQSSLVLMRAVRADRKVCAWQYPTNLDRKMAARASAGWKHYDGPVEVLSELSYAKGFVESELGVDLNAAPRLQFCTKQPVLPNSRRIALGVSGASGSWPAANWIELATRLDRAGWAVTILGGSGAGPISSEIATMVPASENLAGALSLRDTAAFLQKCDAFIGNDTGITHLASLVVRRCLVISGGGTFRRFFPWPDADNQTVLFHALDCFDCDWWCKFSERYCLSLVNPSAAFAAFGTIMSEPDAITREVNLNPGVPSYDLAWRRGGALRMAFDAGQCKQGIIDASVGRPR